MGNFYDRWNFFPKILKTAKTKKLKTKNFSRFDFLFFNEKFKNLQKLFAKKQLEKILALAKNFPRNLIFAFLKNNKEFENVKKMVYRAQQYFLVSKILLNFEKHEKQNQVKLCLKIFDNFLPEKHKIFIQKWAVKKIFKLKNFKTCISLIEKVENFENSEQLKKILRVCQRKAKNFFEIDAGKKIKVDCENLRVVDETCVCFLDGSEFAGERRGQLCGFCGVAELGAEGIGLKLIED